MPQSVVDELPVGAVEAALVVEHIRWQDQHLEFEVRAEEDGQRGCLIELSREDADHAVLEHVDAPDAVRSHPSVQRFHQRERVEALSIEGDRSAVLEGHVDVVGLVGGIGGRRRQRPDVLGRLPVEILDRTRLDVAAEDVQIDRPGPVRE
ncbi:hypothetical protein Q0F99_17695 [Rathayibacter oskolensis]|nr:hypothetical protein [Rathayibacter oskolensis]WKK71277.1 hypothetical protein Q0F99_17695 [Rathayibacter oskolensis]